MADDYVVWTEKKVEYPKILFVRQESLPYPYYELKRLIGRENLESTVPDDEKEHTVGLYQLIAVETYKKKVTRTETVNKVSK